MDSRSQAVIRNSNQTKEVSSVGDLDDDLLPGDLFSVARSGFIMPALQVMFLTTITGQLSKSVLWFMGFKKQRTRRSSHWAKVVGITDMSSLFYPLRETKFAYTSVKDKLYIDLNVRTTQG